MHAPTNSSGSLDFLFARSRKGFSAVPLVIRISVDIEHAEKRSWWVSRLWLEVSEISSEIEGPEWEWYDNLLVYLLVSSVRRKMVVAATELEMLVA